MAGIADQFAGLPIEELIVSPIIGMAKGQAKLNEVTWKYISEVAFVKDEKTGKTSARSLDVEMNRVVTNGATGEQEIVWSLLQVFFNVNRERKVLDLLYISVKLQQKKKKTKFCLFKCEVATNKENTRSTDNSAKYNVKVHAEQLPPTEGMLKLSDYLTQMLEPSLIPLTEERK